MKEHNYYVYILTRERNSVFYVGVTNDGVVAQMNDWLVIPCLSRDPVYTKSKKSMPCLICVYTRPRDKHGVTGLE
jgi:hypothetical protein